MGLELEKTIDKPTSCIFDPLMYLLYENFSVYMNGPHISHWPINSVWVDHTSFYMCKSNSPSLIPFKVTGIVEKSTCVLYSHAVRTGGSETRSSNPQICALLSCEPNLPLCPPEQKGFLNIVLPVWNWELPGWLSYLFTPALILGLWFLSPGAQFYPTGCLWPSSNKYPTGTNPILVSIGTMHSKCCSPLLSSSSASESSATNLTLCFLAGERNRKGSVG